MYSTISEFITLFKDLSHNLKENSSGYREGTTVTMFFPHLQTDETTGKVSLSLPDLLGLGNIPGLRDVDGDEWARSTGGYGDGKIKGRMLRYCKNFYRDLPEGTVLISDIDPALVKKDVVQLKARTLAFPEKKQYLDTGRDTYLLVLLAHGLPPVGFAYERCLYSVVRLM